MLTESNLSSYGSAREVVVEGDMRKFDQSGAEESGTCLPVEHTAQSLAVSGEATSIQFALLKIASDIFLPTAATDLIGDRFSVRQFPMLLDAARVERSSAQRSAIPDSRRARLAARLSAAFETNSLEDGIDHPAEEILREALRSVRSELVLDWFEEFIVDQMCSSFAASVLHCLGRQTSPGTPSWRVKLIRGALAQDDIELRDAAVQSAELWDDWELLDVLRAHHEPEPWLREYIRDVIDNFCE